MSNFHAETIAMLRLIGKRDSISSRELAELIHKTRDVVKTRIDGLSTKGLIDSHREGKGGKAGYFITPKGRKLLEKLDDPQPMGEFPAPRTSPSRETYTGQAPIFTRPGSQDFLNVPSLGFGA